MAVIRALRPTYPGDGWGRLHGGQPNLRAAFMKTGRGGPNHRTYRKAKTCLRHGSVGTMCGGFCENDSWSALGASEARGEKKTLVRSLGSMENATTNNHRVVAVGHVFGGTKEGGKRAENSCSCKAQKAIHPKNNNREAMGGVKRFQKNPWEAKGRLNRVRDQQLGDLKSEIE